MSTQEGSLWPPLPSFTFLLFVHAVPCKLHIQSVVLITIPITEEFLVHQMSNKYSDVQMTDFTANWNISRPQAAVVSPGNRPAGIIHFNHQGRVTLVESSSKSFHGIYKLAICCCHTTLRWIFHGSYSYFVLERSFSTHCPSSLCPPPNPRKNSLIENFQPHLA